MRYVETRSVPIGELEPYPGNARTHDEAALDESAEVNGQYRSIVARQLDSGLQILAGHGTVGAFARRGDKSVRVEVIEADDTEARRILLADNATSRNAGYDEKLLLELIDQASKDGGLPGTGWDEDAYRELLGSLESAGSGLQGDLDQFDEEPPVDPVTRVGDVWVLGRHRLVCADSTRKDVWTKLLGGKRPKMVFTDPPYGIGYQAMRGGRKIQNDANAVDALAVTRDALQHLVGAEAHFVCCDWRSLQTIVDAMQEVGIAPKACIVWDKQSRVQNLDRFAKQHEFIVYAGPYGGEPTVDTDVWQFPRDFDPDHPTPKPVGLVIKAVESVSWPGDVVADAFAGSGPTVIACEVSGRLARVVELDPAYCDVIARRYQDATGDQPVLEKSGLAWDFTAEPPQELAA